MRRIRFQQKSSSPSGPIISEDAATTGQITLPLFRLSSHPPFQPSVRAGIPLRIKLRRDRERRSYSEQNARLSSSVPISGRSLFRSADSQGEFPAVNLVEKNFGIFISLIIFHLQIYL
jgi:hypothetical protein